MSKTPKTDPMADRLGGDDLLLEELHLAEVERALETLALDCLRHGDAEITATVRIDGGAYDVKFTITINPDID